MRIGWFLFISRVFFKASGGLLLFLGETGGVKPLTVLLFILLSTAVLNYRSQETKKVTKKIKRIT
jgi:hypothetical protein